MRNILPYLNQADYIVNSAMPYELSIYKPKLFEYFNNWVQEYRQDALRSDAYERANRVQKVLDEIDPVEDDADVPQDSVIREFIGGSTYEY